MVDLRRLRALALATAAVAALSASMAGSASAATITLDNLIDEVPVATNGVCTLREAINEANINSPISETGGADDCHFSGMLGHDTINLPAGTLTIAAGAGTDEENKGGDFDIALNNANSLVINGSPQGTTIDANEKDRVFDQENAGTSALGNRSLVLRDMTLTGGSSGGGGAISFERDYQDTAKLRLERVNVVENVASGGSGGGIAVRGAVLEMVDVHVDNNVLNGFGGSNVGGGVAVLAGNSPSGLRAVHSTINDNLNDSTSPSGQARRSAGLYLGPNSQEEEPSTFVDGDISGNELRVAYGGLGRGAGVVAIDHSLVMQRATVSGNAITGDSPLEHGFGGIYLTDQSKIADNVFTLENVTVANNNARPTVDAKYTWAGGAAVIGGIAKIVNSTIAGNTSSKEQSTSDGTQLYLQGGGTPNSGTYDQTGDSLSIRGTIVDGENGACDLFNPSSYTHSYTVETRDDTCGFTGGAAGAPGPNGDRENVDPATLGLGPLEDNGGPGPMQALLAGSSLIDAIPVAACLDSEGVPLTTDERGAGRGADAGCDIGAYEVASCGGSAATVNGTSGNDVITGTAGADVIATFNGNDSISGLGGDDVICAGDGVDTLDYSAESASVTASLAGGTATGGSSGADTFTGVENLIGTGLDDSLTGDAAGNRLTGGAGLDTIAGGEGPDSIFVRDSLADNVTCGDGEDSVQADQAGVDSIAADCEGLDLSESVNPPGNPSPLPVPKPGPGQTGAAAKPKCKKIKNKKKRKKCLKKLRAKKK